VVRDSQISPRIVAVAVAVNRWRCQRQRPPLALTTSTGSCVYRARLDALRFPDRSTSEKLQVEPPKLTLPGTMRSHAVPQWNVPLCSM
jgi:hypothetical protein